MLRKHFKLKEHTMLRTMIAVLIAAFFVTASNTMDGLVTDVDHGVSKLQGQDRDRNR